MEAYVTMEHHQRKKNAWFRWGTLHLWINGEARQIVEASGKRRKEGGSKENEYMEQEDEEAGQEKYLMKQVEKTEKSLAQNRKEIKVSLFRWQWWICWKGTYYYQCCVVYTNNNDLCYVRSSFSIICVPQFLGAVHTTSINKFHLPSTPLYVSPSHLYDSSTVCHCSVVISLQLPRWVGTMDLFGCGAHWIGCHNAFFSSKHCHT